MIVMVVLVDLGGGEIRKDGDDDGEEGDGGDGGGI